MSLRRIGVILAHEGRLIRRDPFPLMILVVFPIIDMAFLKAAFRPALVQAGHANANGAEQVVPGQAAMMAFYAVSLVIFAFFSEFTWGTWDRLRASSAGSIEIVLGKAIPRVAMVLVQFVAVFLAGIVIFELHRRDDRQTRARRHWLSLKADANCAGHHRRRRGDFDSPHDRHGDGQAACSSRRLRYRATACYQRASARIPRSEWHAYEVDCAPPALRRNQDRMGLTRAL